MKKIIDISVPLENGMVAWPGSVGFHLSQTMKMSEGGIANNSRLDTDVHIGTHLDAPWHSLASGATVERLRLEDLVGKAYVVDLPEIDTVNADALERARIPTDVERLLIRTRNSKFWKSGEKRFQEDFVGLVPDASEWIVRRQMRLVGIDYLSIQKFTEKSMATHNILLEKEIVVVEGLDLSGVIAGYYEFICLPLRIVGAEGAPARAILLSQD